eukprot:CAMPEP_0178399834 /NCGR_PEP_ID=MMETSP0689_2-20121128/15481_1 /TAXON_ID=160604 /ORGANISM="Amphidinium massartii, Strain CS-259" /LENGTH=432 /DNA_ID=CAMNT_0020020617 /DNA_START=22 /DNA_END=1317 /DNA_ORIENTATION=+
MTATGGCNLSEPGAVTSAPIPPPPLPTPAHCSTGLPDDRPRVAFLAQVHHKRAYGNRLLFLDVQVKEDGAAGHHVHGHIPDDPRGVEVVFAFEVFGQEVRKVRKEICPGDVIFFEGAFRTGSAILDAVAYKSVEKWSASTEGVSINAMRSAAAAAKQMEAGGVHGGRSRSASRKAAQQPRRGKGALLCKFWLSNGQCRRQDCKCDHPEGEELQEARRKQAEQQKERRALNADPNDPHAQESKKSHGHRASVFVDFLCSVYGLETLQQHGVVEIAGGRGEVAFELAVKRGIPCTVVDPRCPGSSEGQSSLAAAPWRGWRLTRPQKMWLEAQANKGLRGYAACQAYVETCPIRQCCAAVSPECAAEGSADRQLWFEVIGDCCAVIGLHPDQATGGVVELARAFGRPFSVVPCCTFADDFPERRLQDGSPVRTYD